MEMGGEGFRVIKWRILVMADRFCLWNNINIVGYSKIWPIKERDCLNTLVSHLHNCNNPGLQVITGIEGLSLTEEEASSSQNTIQEDLNQFQANFFTSSVMFPTPPLLQDSDPWVGPLSQNPYAMKRKPMQESILFYPAQPM
ncbi:hypothetical protein PIB30_103653 [Stylosanthes scabra]|uniref:Uncharacterized protein n=1 Tax=Stylosanthes scabra TaxID=79078 RepID=A0ABU6RYL1_9FABA|nr:hypothetical protein [Stylosanthes scabra]